MLALEASRLARNNRDWHHLIDLCAMAGTLVIDHDGVYDPGLLNDRLLLGLKGTMSEFEMSLLRQRAMEAHRDKVRRGLVLTQVPRGLHPHGRRRHREDAGSPDTGGHHRYLPQVPRTGSIRQVMLWYREEKLLIPVFIARDWQPQGDLVRTYISNHHRLPQEPHLCRRFRLGQEADSHEHRPKGTHTRHVAMLVHRKNGEVVIPDHHEGYITWEEFMRNQEQIRSNAGWNARMGQTPGAARNGPALLAGLFALRALWAALCR